MPEFEFIVKGPPFSVNPDNPKKRAEWQIEVNQAAKIQWEQDMRETLLPLAQSLSVTIITFYRAVKLDVDNVIKPILDSLDEKQQEAQEVKRLLVKLKRRGVSWFVLYQDDKQVDKVISERINQDGLRTFSFPSPLLASALRGEDELVYISVAW